jgi:DMSO/TMAO reductase YedYZ molybdopterin-dependent catalytic subunit
MEEMKQALRRRRIGFGVLLGALTGMVVIAVTYAASQVAELVFSPFSLFDFMARVLPGSLVTFAIDKLVGIITSLNLGPTSDTAKLAEQTIALVQFVALGGVFGGVLGALRDRENFARLPAYGLGLGLLLAVAFFGVEAYLDFPTLGPVGTAAWLILVFGGWGLILGWMLRGTYRARTEAPDAGLSRRELIYLGGTALVVAIASAIGLGFLFSGQEPERETAAAPTPSGSETSGPAASAPETVLAERIKPAPGTRSEITPTDDFYRIDINTRPPVVDAANWQLEIGGLVDKPTTLTLDEIRARPSVSQYITLSCISNRLGGDLISTALFTGTPLKSLLEDVRLQPEATSLYIEAKDGFFETVVMADMMDERTLLVYAMNDQPLPHEHGFPLRIYIPNRYGMKQPKWIVRMEAVTDERPGYWVERGWSRSAIMRTTSVIDAISVAPVGDGQTRMGGIAHAGERGISKIEVQVDDGTWQDAELRIPPLSPLTWVQWRLVTLVPAGKHIARVRAYDGTGQLQILEENPPHPNGATGVYSRSFDV